MNILMIHGVNTSEDANPYSPCPQPMGSRLGCERLQFHALWI